MELLEKAKELEQSRKIEEEDEDDPMKVVRNLKRVDDFPEVRLFRVEKLPDFDYSKIGQTGRELKTKYRDMPVQGFGIPPVIISETGLPSVDTTALKMLADGHIAKHFQWFYQKVETAGDWREADAGSAHPFEHAPNKHTNIDVHRILARKHKSLRQQSALLFEHKHGNWATVCAATESAKSASA